MKNIFACNSLLSFLIMSLRYIPRNGVIDCAAYFPFLTLPLLCISLFSLYGLHLQDSLPFGVLGIQWVAPGGDEKARWERSWGISSSLSSCFKAVATCPSPPPAQPPFMVVPTPPFQLLLDSISLFPTFVPLSPGMVTASYYCSLGASTFLITSLTWPIHL